jgi:hypothetical protein
MRKKNVVVVDVDVDMDVDVIAVEVNQPLATSCVVIA